MESRAGDTLELTLKNEQLLLRTTWADAIMALVDLFLAELKKVSAQLWVPGLWSLGLWALRAIGLTDCPSPLLCPGFRLRSGSEKLHHGRPQPPQLPAWGPHQAVARGPSGAG